MKRLLRTEPALLYGFVGSVVALLVAFGLDLTTGQVGAIMTVVSALLGLLTRQSVYSPATVSELTGGAHGQDPPEG